MNAEELLEKYGASVDRLYDTVASADVYDRQFGAELTEWELKLHEGFRERISANKNRIRGFVKYTRTASLILLTPSPWMLEGEFVYFGEGVPIPSDGSFVEISGPNVLVPQRLERGQSVVRALLAEEVVTQTHDITSIVTNPPKLRDLSRMLFENVGMAEASKRVFAQLYVSSPPSMETVGGLTAGIQAIASKPQVNRLFRFMNRILPPSMRTPKASKNVRGIIVKTPKQWRMEAGTIGKSEMQSLCLNRRDPSGYREVSLAALTENTTAALPDVPIALASEDFWIENSNPTELRLPILKATITYQLLTPEISKRSLDSAQSYVLERIEGLRSSFGLAENSLARGNILDADVLGRPLSVIRLAHASARAYWKPKVTAKELKSAWDRVLEPALREFIEIAELKESSGKQWGEDTKLERYNTKVVKALQKLDSGKRGSTGPTLDEIAQEAGVDRHKVALALNKMKEEGLIYEPKIDHFRLV
ncbi:MAG: hypothetical protein P1Q69_09285 [Candidatus Thorarchaeota archaeon]|nr:hypothetical protein [Candidatus Thorarchaeota archaeon]